MGDNYDYSSVDLDPPNAFGNTVPKFKNIDFTIPPGNPGHITKGFCTSPTSGIYSDNDRNSLRPTQEIPTFTTGCPNTIDLRQALSQAYSDKDYVEQQLRDTCQRTKDFAGNNCIWIPPRNDATCNLNNMVTNLNNCNGWYDFANPWDNDSGIEPTPESITCDNTCKSSLLTNNFFPRCFSSGNQQNNAALEYELAQRFLIENPCYYGVGKGCPTEAQQWIDAQEMGHSVVENIHNMYYTNCCTDRDGDGDHQHQISHDRQAEAACRLNGGSVGDCMRQSRSYTCD